MNVKRLMNHDVACVGPTDLIRTAAEKMLKFNVGALPVLHHETLVGIITDRDITIRAVATRESPGSARVDEMMSSPVTTCHEDQDLRTAVELFRKKKVGRLPVMTRDGRLKGILSLGDVASVAYEENLSRAVLNSISLVAERRHGGAEAEATVR